LAGRGAARFERADVDTGEAHDQRLNEADRRDGPSLTARAASDLRRSSVGCSALMVANLAYIVTSSRLLDPAAFQLMALAQLVVLFALFLTQVWASYAPAAFASAGVALAMGVIRRALATEAPTLVTFAAEVAAGAFARSLCIRFCPLPTIRRELRMRLTAAGVLGGVGGLRWRLAPLVLGQPDPRS
jgi:hypothetical protein